MSQADWQVAICSYKRSQTLAKKTMAYLARCGIAMERVTVFVADAQERAIYGPTLPPGCRLVVAQPGMRAVRNFVQGYYAEGARVFNLDDDIAALYRKVDDKKAVPLLDLEREIETGFELCARWHLRLWGVCAVLNPMFMTHGVSTNLKYIVGCAWGVVNSHDARLSVTLDDKEDFERTIKFYLADGGVLRLNYVAPKTRYYKEPGGMQVERTPARVDASARWLLQKYPSLCRLRRRKGGFTEIALRDTRKTSNPKKI